MRTQSYNIMTNFNFSGLQGNDLQNDEFQRNDGREK
jgi:hypothetical protein